MANLYKKLFIPVLLLLATTGGVWAQERQLNYSLYNNETGVTRTYVAHDYIILRNGFINTATPGHRFIAKIDTSLVYNLIIQTNPVPGVIPIIPDVTIPHPGDNFIESPTTPTDGLITIRQIVNTNKHETSYLTPALWFKTAPVSGNLNGVYKWKDVSKYNIPLLNYDAQGAGHGNEYGLTRDKIRTYNFNPAIDLSYGSISKEILIKSSNLSQATIIGVWGPKEEELKTNKFMFAINGRCKESFMFTKDSVIPSYESKKDILTYGDATAKNLKYQSTGSEVSETKFHESSLRIGTYYKYNRPDNSVWGEQQQAVISVGNKFDTTNVNNTSKFKQELNNFPGFKGYTPELLVFDQMLSPVESNIFESYLAIKYGLSLEKSYISASGNVIWDYDSNKPYSNRITGYGREDKIGLNQKMATTSYEEAPYYSEQSTNDSYDLGDTYNLSTRNRLLVMGRQPANPMYDGDYVMFGDNDDSITTTTTLIPGFSGIMPRKWIVNTNMAPTYDPTLSWNISVLDITSNSNFKSTITKTASQSLAYAVTSIPLKGNDGQLAWTVGAQPGPLTVKFCTNNQNLSINDSDYGYKILSNGEVFTIIEGIESGSSIFKLQPEHRVEFDKVGSVLYLRVNGVRYKSTEIIITNPTDLSSKYYGCILIGNNTSTVTMTNLRHGGFVDTGNRIELSYFDKRARSFDDYKFGNTYLLIDRTGRGDFSNAEQYANDELDENRSKIIFNNVFWSGKDAFTFACKIPPGGFVKKDPKPINPESTDEKSSLSIYYKDMRDMSMVTVKLKLIKPSASTVVMYDMMGRLIYKTDLSSSPEVQLLDIKLPTTGVYIVKAITPEGELSAKVISKIGR